MPALSLLQPSSPFPSRTLLEFLLLLICLLIVLEMAHGSASQPSRRELLDVFWQSFRRGLRQGWRGYFALLHHHPWQIAWRTWRRPNGTLQQALRAGWADIHRLINDEAVEAGRARANQRDRP